MTVEPIEGMIQQAITKMRRHGYTPADARRSMIRWAYKPDKKLISQAVRIAATRMGIEVDYED